MKIWIGLAVVLWGWCGAAVWADNRPNIVLVITDDQGYGDLGYTGNPVVKTPHIDQLAAESSQLSDYHVAPTCSPTRAALMTGHWTDRTGVWHTINGRSMLRENEVTVAQMLQSAGYATGMFGKWHLGDNYPYRAEDRGFNEVYRHGGGGVGQTPDLWNNAYFDGSYFHNGQVAAAQGFCTDVFFDQAQQFIRAQAAAKRPFFAYIAPNAPHGPLHAPADRLAEYQDQNPAVAAFYAMIANIDENVGATRQLLHELGIAHNTLFIFTTDNGTASGAEVFNAGMRGAKGSEYEGGHRVPFLAHWPAAGWNRAFTNPTLCHAVDIAPTLLDVTGTKKLANVKFDGLSIRSLLDPANSHPDWPHDRVLVTDSQRVSIPVKWKQTAVMSGPWRLVNGKELYDLRSDPGQRKNLIEIELEQAARLRSFYDDWWAELEPTFAQTTEIVVGHPEHPVVNLTGHDWISEDQPPWNQEHIRRAAGFGDRPARGGKNPPPAAAPSRFQGHWAIKVMTEGQYTISLRRWPVEADQPITLGLEPEPNVPGASKAFRTHRGVAIPIITATLQVDGTDRETLPVPRGATSVSFTTTLSAGSHQLAPRFASADGHEVGAYYTVITAGGEKRP